LVATAKVRHYVNTEFHGSLNLAVDLQDFPSDASRGDLVVINGVLWTYTMIGGLLTWLPLNNKQDTYVHTQAVASLAWSVNHGMGTQDFVLGLYDSTNQPMSPASISDVTDDSFTINFTEAIIGRAVLIFATNLFAPTVTAQSLVADSVNIGGNVVTADSTGLYVNGNPVLTLNSQGQADYGTL
jgi:hypothetical protein